MDLSNNYYRSEITYDRQTIIVIYIPQQMSGTEFHQLVQPFGEVVYAKLITCEVKGIVNNMGYGFAKYTTEVAAIKAVCGLNKLRVCHKTLKV